MGKLVDMCLRVPLVASDHLHGLHQRWVALAGRPEANALKSAVISAFSSSRNTINEAFR